MFEDEFFSLKRELTLRAYSKRTFEAYQGCLKGYFIYLESIGIRKANDNWEKRLDPETLRTYLFKMHGDGKAPNTINLHLNAVLFYFRHVCRHTMSIKIPFAKKAKRLPVVLSREEVGRVLDTIKNPKHYLMIALAYGAGLRVSEVVTLRVGDCDFPAGFLRIRQAKGKKDRVSFIPKRVHGLLYRFTQGKSPTDYIFQNQQRGPFEERVTAHAQGMRLGGGVHDFSGERLSARTAQVLFKQALQKAGIQKDASFHSLRHSFATGMLEKGADIHHLQTLMGHSSIKTTQGYLHITPKSLRNLESPL